MTNNQILTVQISQPKKYAFTYLAWSVSNPLKIIDPGAPSGLKQILKNVDWQILFMSADSHEL